MKLFKTQLFEHEEFKRIVCIPTTKWEYTILQELKYKIIDEDEIMSNFHPERLGKKVALKYMKALGFENPVFHGNDSRLTYEVDGVTYDLTATPSNIHVLIAGYRMLGKHRKVARIIKDLKRLNAMY